ncbi:hypothetical protein C2E23DRAFT_815036 [Lenzites betulinus]|nr:hypothetical protein C2E23DRAFT_815036 [Lenzites betulinus]
MGDSITKKLTSKTTKRHQPYNLKQARAVSRTGPTTVIDPSSSKRIVQSHHKVSTLAKQGCRVQNKSERLKDIQDALSDCSQISSPSNSASSFADTTPLWTPRETLRDCYRETVHQFYPYYTPKDDFEILALSDVRYKGEPTVEGISRFIAEALAPYPNHASAVQMATRCLDMKADITGIKPRPGDPGVFSHPLPGSDYSVRLFPGSKAASEYCLDFVLSKTGKPVNSPFEFSLFAGPGPTTPMGYIPTVGIEPLECSFGISKQDISPGAEKFVLRDGQLCTLRRPGHKDVQFVVPTRRRPEPAKPDIDTLEFPEYV